MTIFILAIPFTTTTIAQSANNINAFAQLSQIQHVIFRNVTNDPNPVPNKPFKVNATISVSDILNRHVLLSLSVPKEISVTGSAIADLGDISSRDGARMATWTLVATSSGSFNLNLTAYSSSSGIGGIGLNNFESNSFLFNLSIGSLKSLIVTGVDVPGNILPSDLFTATMKLKNTGTIPADNVIAQLSVPTGLQLIDRVASNIASIKPGEEIPISWKLKAEKSGSFPIFLNYSSINAGSSFIAAIANVGDKIISNIRPSQIFLAGSPLSSSIVGPGDKNLPLNITLVNDGTLPLVNVTAALVLSEPFFWSYKENSTTSIETHTQTFHSGSIRSGEMQTATYFINARKLAKPDTYTNHLKISFSDGKLQHQIIYNIPISISSNTAVSIFARTTNIIPDYYSPVTLSIVNKGEVSLHAVQLSTSPSTVANTYNNNNGNTSISPSPYFSIDTPYWIGDLGVGENKTAVLRVYIPHEKLEQYPLPIALTYEASGKQLSETHLVGIGISGTPQFQIHDIRVFPSLSYPGDVNTLVNVNIINSGYGIANNVTTVLNLPHGLTPTFGSANTEYFGRILPNQNFTASYFLNINTNTASGSYPLTVSTKYYNSKNDNGKTILNTSFLVSPKAKFDLLNIANSDQLYPGATNVPVKVTLKNTGTATAQTITAKFLSGNAVPGVKSPLETAIGNTENVGSILPGEVFTIVFVVNVDSSASAAGQQAASIQLSWTQSQTTGTPQNPTNAFLQTLPITYHVAEGPNYLLYHNGIPWTYVAIAIILAILVLIFIVKRQRRINRTNLYLQREFNQQEKTTAAKQTENAYRPSGNNNKSDVPIYDDNFTVSKREEKG